MGAGAFSVDLFMGKGWKDQSQWIGFDIVNENGSPAQGARAAIYAGGQTWWRWVKPGGSYQSSNDPRIHIGLGDKTTVDSIRVQYLDGSQVYKGPFESNQYHQIVSGF